MSHDVIATCPVCANELFVTRLRCSECATVIEGEFKVGRFAGLTREQTLVLESFLRSRGNLRDMERELGISYPTVRARVESLVRALGFGPRDEPDASAPGADGDTPDGADAGAANSSSRSAVPEVDIPAARRAILERLAAHELSADEAAAAIRSLGRTNA